MAIRFRKKIKIAPGISVNVSKSGLSTSIGGRGASVNVGKKGVRTTVGVPGTGISHSTLHTGNKKGKAQAKAKVKQPSDSEVSKGGSILRFLGIAIAVFFFVSLFY